MKSEIVMSIVRHALTAFGGAMIMAGWMPGVLTDAVLSEGIGIVVALMGLVWGIVDKIQAKDTEDGGSGGLMVLVLCGCVFALSGCGHVVSTTEDGYIRIERSGWTLVTDQRLPGAIIIPVDEKGK